MLECGEFFIDIDIEFLSDILSIVHNFPFLYKYMITHGKLKMQIKKLVFLIILDYNQNVPKIFLRSER